MWVLFRDGDTVAEHRAAYESFEHNNLILLIYPLTAECASAGRRLPHSREPKIKFGRLNSATRQHLYLLGVCFCFSF
jgi:hypothetical protein